MRIKGTLYILLLCGFFSACQLQSETAKNQHWTVLSWNVQNLFDGSDNGAEYDEFLPSSGWTDELYRLRLDRTAQGIGEAFFRGPYLLVLQEVENLSVLHDLASGPLVTSCYHWIACPASQGPVRVGVLSRYPLHDVVSIECGFWRNRTLRPFLGFSVDIQNLTVRVYVLHWKSPRDGQVETEEARRLEAQVLVREILGFREIHPDIPILVMGDFNAAPENPPPLPAMAFASNVYASDAIIKLSQWDEAFQFQESPLSLRDFPFTGGTYWFREDWQRPDRILYLPSEENDWLNLEDSFIPGGRLLTPWGTPLRWNIRNREGFSDHLPLALEFDLSP